MSRRKKPIEERLIDLVEEAGLEAVRSSLRTIELLWKKTPQVDIGPFDVGEMVKRTLTVPKAKQSAGHSEG